MMLQDYVTDQADRRPDATAVVYDSTSITYGFLEQEANQLARLLEVAGCQPGDRVGLLLPKSPVAVTAMLAVLKAGCIYVPVDPESPAERVSRILNAADCRCLLISAPALEMIGQLFGPAELASCPDLIWVDRTPPPDTPTAIRFVIADADVLSGDPVDSVGREDMPAHILFTSGSTGMPKGVVVTHASVKAYVTWANGYFGLSADDRISCHPPLHFDLSTYDIYGGFAAGAEVNLVPPGLNLLPRRLVAFMRERRLTQWVSVPSVLAYLARFDAVQHDDFPDLMRLIWCGEVFPPLALKYWMERLPHVTFTNLYGPTEATIASSYFTVRTPPADASESVPIGQACTGESLHILDANLQPADVGEIYISGVGITNGYWRDTARTKQAFVEPDGRWAGQRLYRTGDLGRRDAEGMVHFLGRVDSQIKSRGHRIELGEVETALHSLQEIGQGVIVAYESADFGGHIICCAYVPASGDVIEPVDVKTRLAEMIPRYMLPARWRRMGALPTNANGKADRVALREMFKAETSQAEVNNRG